MPDTELPPAPPRAPLYAVMPPEGQVTLESLLDGFLAYCAQRGLSLYPAQEEAILELFDGKSVILNTPTGSGKSLVALAAHWKAVADGGRSFYTAPIKALVSEKFFELCEAFGPQNVGMMTGDASINRDAPVICCTAEILSNLALREGDQADVDMVVIDEFHFYSERDRGVAWQVPLLTLPQARFLLMSATLGDTARFEESIAQLTGAPVALVKTMDRPVPLDWEYAERPLHETLLAQLEARKTPIYVVHFAQRAASEHAQDLMSIDFLSKEDKAAIKQELTGFRWDTPFGAELRRFVHHGVGVHHAGMLPKYRRVVERLAGKGLLKIICGTDTLGVGVNIPLRTVVFTKLCKYDGDKTKILTVRDFHQIAGRAGRKGFDTQGTVIVQAPEHVIENKIAQQKATGDAKKLRKWKPSKPPERGYAHWDEQTFQKLRDGEPERLVSRFAVSHGMMLNVFTRPDGCTAMKRLIRASHDAPVRQRQHGRHALAILRSLIKADIVALRRGGVDLNADLQTDFSLNQALSLYVVEAVAALDRENGDYALNLVSLVEATLEDPSAVLFKQVDTLKGRAVASLKSQGVEYDERMAELEKIEAPKPNAEFMLGTFRMFAEHHPWVGSDSLRLKSVARDMFEQGETFNGYVRTYGLARAEGVLLRYLSDVYKALIQTIPEDQKTNELDDIIEWLGVVIRSVDGSLLAEWERMKRGEVLDERAEEEALLDAERKGVDVTANRKAFRVLVRNATFRLVRALAQREERYFLDMVQTEPGQPPLRVEELVALMDPYWAEYDELRIDAEARGPQHFQLEENSGSRWLVSQSLLDPEEHLEWRLRLAVDLSASRDEGGVVLRWVGLDRPEVPGTAQ
jgi:superfamily II RNA helicase